MLFRGRILFMLLAFYCQKAYSQQADSLIHLLNSKSLLVEKQLQLYDDISWDLINSDFKNAIRYGREGYQLAVKTNNEGYAALFLRNIGVAYYMGDMYDSAHYYLDRAYLGAENIHDEKLQAKALLAKANVYLQTSFYDKANETYLKALKLTEKLGMDRESGKIYHNIGVGYQRMDQMEPALKHFKKSREIAEKIGDTYSMAFLNMAISNIYMESDPEKAISLAKASLDGFRENGDAYNEGMGLLTISQCLYTIGKHDAAEDYALQALEIADATEFLKLRVEVLNVLANIYYHKKIYSKSISYAESALELDTTTSHLVGNLFAIIAKSAVYAGDKEKAVEYMDKYNSHINKFAGENYQSALSELEVKYETEKKEYQITALEKQKLWMTVAIGIALVAMALLVIYYIGRSRLMKERERLNQEKLERLEREKQLVATQAALEGETSERSRLARDLHDGLGSMLSVVKHSIPAIQAGTVIDSESEKRFNRALGLLDESIGELRRIAHHMMPESLIRLGLKEALQDFCQAHEKLTFAFYGNEERIDSKLEVLIYRAVQELVTNALKHAQASMINVQVIQEPRRISITVEDNGKGFEVKQTGKSGMGLQNLKHRVHSYGGIMDISSGKGGTEIIMEFKIKPYTI